MTQAVSPLDVGKYLQELSSTARTLNELTDKLTKEVSAIEDAVNRLNLGVETSVRFEEWGDESGAQSGWWRLAYGKHAGKWCLLVEYLTEDRNVGPAADTYETWLFKDAPRDARIKAVGKIPDLLARLVKESQNLAEKISEKLTYAEELAKSLAPATDADTLRKAVLDALSEHPMVASLLSEGRWKLEGNSLLVTVAASLTMINMAFSSDARRMAGAAASKQAGRAIKVQVLPSVLPAGKGANDPLKTRKESQ